jgi:hypothetical protein
MIEPRCRLAGDVAVRTRQARNEALFDRIGDGYEDDRYGACRPLERRNDGRVKGNNQVGRQVH